MKLNKIFFMLLTLIFAAACNKPLSPLTGEYNMEQYTFTSIKLNSFELVGKVKVLDITLKDDKGNTLDLAMGSPTWKVASGTYKSAASITKGRQYTGTLTVNGETTPFTNDIVLNITDTTYFMTSMSDDLKKKYSFAGCLTTGHENDREAIELSKVLSANSNLQSGSQSVTVQLSTDDITATQSMTGTTYTGTGNFLAIDFYSADGYLHEGKYTACTTGGSIGAGEFGIGWDPGDLFNTGINFTNWGTCWWTVNNGEPSAAKILTGTIEVTRNGNIWTIFIENPVCFAEFTGAIPALNDPATSETLTKCLAANDYSSYGGCLTIQLATNGVSLGFNPATSQMEYSGTGNYLSMDIKSLEPGTYTACATGGQVGNNEFGIGYDQEYDYTQWGGTAGVNYDYGTCWWTVADGEKSAVKVTDGTVTVEKNSDTYTITLKSSVVNAVYTGAITIQ